MQTLCLSANYAGAIEQAVKIIRAGGLVAFPTETVYGLGGNALDTVAVKKIFIAKERPRWDPLIVHVSSREMLESLASKMPAKVDDLFSAFMPGPLTLVLPKNAMVPDIVTAGRDTVAVRFPAHPVAERLIAESGVPIAAPSANRFQHVSPTRAEHVLADLDGRIEAVLDGGPCPIGVESTVLDLTAGPRILRQGGVTAEQLRRLLGKVDAGDAVSHPPEKGLPSPGMVSRHYAPRTKLVLSDGQEDALAEVVQPWSEQEVGVLLPSGWHTAAPLSFDWGRWGDWSTLAARLYAGLRWLDEQEPYFIVAPLPPEEGLGSAIRQRLLKAASTATDRV
ncbi:MAG TPA: L-threonylcarbamoyladenylate synthase [Terriglobales bacterium]|nr:L-threonylcarbamoyladenylate synthase [Terriglobales bacterium]